VSKKPTTKKKKQKKKKTHPTPKPTKKKKPQKKNTAEDYSSQTMALGGRPSVAACNWGLNP